MEIKNAQFELIQAQESDLDFMLQLRKATMVEHLQQAGVFLTDEQHRTRVAHQFDHSFIIHHNDNKVGMIKYVEAETHIKILQIQIFPDFQGQGLGRQVLNYFIQQVRQQNKSLSLTVLKDNPAQQLYQRLGFAYVGEDDLEFHMELE
ncbi:GNAT family N-acetyltransferase [Neptunicella sp.]|uniref:GNAT family N-acetyltransferase n=1 Tax=Neptunicella sp. TaxID=2125986 RepID=UPI003F68CBE9